MNSTIRDKQNRYLNFFEKGKHGSRLASWISKTAAVLFWLLLWYAAAAAVDTEILIPRPLSVGKSFLHLFAEANYWQSILFSIGRILAGFTLAFLIGILLGLVTYKFVFLRDLLYPFLHIVKATPVASFIILTLMWFSTGRVPVFTSFLMVLPTVWSNVYEGLEHTDRGLVEMGAVYGMNRGAIFRHIYLPSLRPYLRAAVRSGFGMAWKAGVAAEVIGRPEFSIGTNLYQSKIYLEMPELFAWTITVVVISILLEKLMGLAVRVK